MVQVMAAADPVVPAAVVVVHLNYYCTRLCGSCC
jgi:hypothetical protein